MRKSVFSACSDPDLIDKTYIVRANRPEEAIIIPEETEHRRRSIARSGCCARGIRIYRHLF